jgi:hypothetical protein
MCIMTQGRESDPHSNTILNMRSTEVVLFIERNTPCNPLWYLYVVITFTAPAWEFTGGLLRSHNIFVIPWPPAPLESYSLGTQ